MSSIPKQLLDQLFAGESETLEFKRSIHDPSILARLIAAFSNANGGTVLIGVSEPPEVVGVDPDVIEKLFKASLRQVEPSTVRASLNFIDGGDGKKVAAVDIEKSSQLVLSRGGAYIRSGQITRAMAQAEILQMLTQVPMMHQESLQELTPESPQEIPRESPKEIHQETLQATLQTLAQSLASHTIYLEEISADNKELKEELKKANAPSAKWIERAYGCIFGVVASLVATALAGVF